MSSTITYSLRCPQCGMSLSYHAGHPDAAPWVCYQCHLGFWKAQLSHEARALYRPLFRDWGFSKEAKALQEQVNAEHLAAIERGTSLLHEHIGMTNAKTLRTVMANWNLAPDFADHVANSLQAKEGQ